MVSKMGVCGDRNAGPRIYCIKMQDWTGCYVQVSDLPFSSEFAQPLDLKAQPQGLVLTRSN